MVFPLDIEDPCKKRNEHGRIIAESIITHKIYDSCRAKDCISVVAFAAEPTKIGENIINKGEVIPVPLGSGKVDMSELQLKRAKVTSKKPSPFKDGFWDIEVKFVFEYLLTFKACNNSIINVRAFSIYKKNYNLFGSVGLDVASSIEHAPLSGEPIATKGEPFSMLKAKTVALKAEFRCNHRELIPVDVAVTIGLSSIMTLFRVVSLDIDSKGFHIPKECNNHYLVNPCDFFNSINFPLEAFAPPKRNEF